MKCPKCGYNSFDHLEECKKCGNDMVDHKGKFGLRSLLFPRRTNSARETEVPFDEPTAKEDTEENVAFGFDFMNDAETGAVQEETSLEDLLGEEDTSGHEGIAAASPQKAETAIESADKQASLEATPSGVPGETGSTEENFSEELDFDLDWEGEPVALSDAGVNEDPTETKLPELDDWSLAEDETDKKDQMKSGETSERKEPDAPFEEGGDDTSVSPASEELWPSATEEHPEASGDDVPDFASLFLDSVEASPDASAVDGPTSPKDTFPPLDRAPDGSVLPGELPPVSAEASLTVPPLPDAGGENPVKEEPSGETPPVESLPAELPGEDSAPSDTEEEHAIGPRRSMLGARLGASLADLLALALLFALFLGAGKFALFPGDRGHLLPPSAILSELAIPYFLVLFALCFAYFTLFHFLTGQTPGKMFFGLRVETEAGTDLLLSQAFLRSVGGLLSLLPAGLGYLRICFDCERRGWNDRLAGSRVVPVHGMVEEVASGE